MDYSAKYALCPFYSADKDIFISCNEGVKGASGIRLAFPNGKAMRMHKACFCDYKYQNCPIYAMLGEKYK